MIEGPLVSFDKKKIGLNLRLYGQCEKKESGLWLITVQSSDLDFFFGCTGLKGFTYVHASPHIIS